MTNIILGSLFCRALFSLRLYYRSSVLGKTLNFLAGAYETSFLKRLIARVFGTEALMTERSCYNRLLTSSNRRLFSLKARLEPIVGGSLLFCCCSRVFASELFKGSLVYRLLFKNGLRRLLIIIFALYLPIDYLLRDVISLPLIPSIWDEVFLIFALLYILWQRVFAPEPVKPRTTPLDLPVLLFFGVGVFLMGAVSPFPSIAIAGYRATVQYILWFFVLIRLLDNDGDVMAFYYTFVAIGVLIALHGVYQFIIAVPIPASWTTSTEAGVRTRVFSIFGSPNIMGDFMVLLAPMTAALAYCGKGSRWNIFFWGCTFLMCFACLFTFSRGAWLGLAAAVLVFALLNDKKLIALLVLAAVVAIFIPDVYNRIAFLFTSEFQFASAKGGRASRWELGMLYLTEHSNPLFGFGLGLFGGAVAMQNRVYSWISYFYMDNYYLKILVEMGYLGLTAFLFMLASLAATSLRSIFRAKHKDRGETGALAAGIFSGLCGVLVHCLYENIFEEPYMMAYFWGLAAVLVYLGFVRKEKRFS